MRHPDHATLRRLLEQPAAVPDADRTHVAACGACLDALAAARGTASTVPEVPAVPTAPAVTRVPAGTDVPAATDAPGVAALGRPADAARRRDVRALLRRPAVVGVAVAAVLAAGGAAAATDRFAIFRTEQVEPVAVSAEDLVALPDLSAYGDVEVTGGASREVADAAAAAEATGLDVPQVAALPGGVQGEPALRVVDEVTATFRYDAARAADAAGGELPAAPAGLDGSEVRMVAGPAAVQLWSHGTGAPSLVVGRAVAPTATATGVTFEQARDHVLSLPGVPQALADQLRSFTADGGALPLPVPDGVTSRAVEVGGAPATVLEARDRTVAAVVWVDDGVVTVVAGALDADEVLAVAEDLR